MAGRDRELTHDSTVGRDAEAIWTLQRPRQISVNFETGNMLLYRETIKKPVFHARNGFKGTQYPNKFLICPEAGCG